MTCKQNDLSRATEAYRLGSIPSRMTRKTWKTIFTCSLVVGVNARGRR